MCAALAQEVETLSGGRLGVRSLRDPGVRALLTRARPGWRWEPMLVEMEGERVRVFAGLAMRWRLVQLLGPVRALRAAQAVARHGGPLRGVDWGRRRFLNIAFVFAVILLLFRIQSARINTNSLNLSGNDIAGIPEVRQALTLKEVYRLLLQYAGRLSEMPTVTGLQSIDLPGDTADAGLDGRRRGWIGTLQTDREQITVRVEDGYVREALSQPLSEPLPSLPELVIDSPQALRQAQSAYPDLKPSSDLKGQGLHYFLGTTESGESVVGILGIRGKQRSRILVNSQSGRVVAAQTYTWAGEGGILYSTDGGRTWFASDLRGRMVKAIAISPGNPDVAYAVAPDPGGIVVYRTRNGGANWEEWGRLPPEAGDWPFDAVVVGNKEGRETLLVGTWTGVWQSRDGRSWSPVNGELSGPVQWLVGLESQSGERLFISVTAGEDRGLYAGTEDGRWTRIARGVYRLSPSVDGRSIIAVDEETPGQALLLQERKVQAIKVPASLLEAAGDFARDAAWLVRSPSGGVGLFRNDTDDVQWTLPGPIASVAVSPAYPTERVALAGGFRGGIFRTTDGGKHWERVLAWPSALIPGSDEIYEIVFLSPEKVLAIQGGRMTWQQR